MDSGAQMTIMSKACAERTGLMRLLDTRFSGMAVRLPLLVLHTRTLCPASSSSPPPIDNLF